MKNKGFQLVVDELNRKWEIKNEHDMYKALFTGRQHALDSMTIALGRYGFTPEQLHEFRLIYTTAEEDYAEEKNSDDDKQLWYASDRIDKEIKKYVLPEDFIPYEERFPK